MSKIVKIEQEVDFPKGEYREGGVISFDDGSKLEVFHHQDCCEKHYLDLATIKLEDVKDLEFDLSKDNFFERVVNYGIRLLPTNNHPVPIPGYGSNNGYYSSDLNLKLITPDRTTEFEIRDCQDINWWCD
jgi:hypothetical protein